MIQFPVWIISATLLILSVVMFYNNYRWRTETMKDKYSICGFENLPPMMIAAVGVMFLIPYIPVEMVV